MRYLKLTLTLAILSLCSCAVSTPLSKSESKAALSNGIHIYERETSKPHFTVIGTTVFNNQYEVIPNVPTFAQHVADRLRKKGVKVTISGESVKSAQLRLFPVYPYQQPELTGLGVSRRSFLGVSGPLITHCNFVSGFEDEANGRPLKSFGGSSIPMAGYQMKGSQINREMSSWSELSPGEKATLKRELIDLMDQASDPILQHLGF